MDGNLYFDDSKVASNVEFVLSSGNNLGYITKELFKTFNTIPFISTIFLL